MKDRALFTVCAEGEFFGRVSEMDYVVARAGRRPSPSIFLFGRRWIGKTEVLRRVYSSLFWEQAGVVPLYFQFRPSGSPGELSEAYLKEVLKQYLAFRLRDARLVKSELSLDRIERELVDNDLYDLADLAAVHREARSAGDSAAALRCALSSPAVVCARSGIPVYLMIDDLDQAESASAGDKAAAREIMASLAAGPLPFVATATTRRLLDGGALSGSSEAVELSGLDEDIASAMMAELCRQHGTGFDTEILKLAAHRLEGNPMYMRSLVWAASRSGAGLATLKDFASAYTQEVFEGNIGLALRSALNLGGISSLRALHACSVADRPLTDEELSSRLRQEPSALRGTIDALAAAGLVDSSLGSVRWAGDAALKDFVCFAYETRVKGRSADEVKTYVAREVLKEGFGFKSSKISLKLGDEVAEVVRSFNSQRVLRILFRHQAFAARFSKKPAAAAHAAEDDLELPQSIGCFSSERLEAGETGPPIIVAHGFQSGRYDSGSEVVWVVAVKDSLAPVNLGDVENFLRRSLILRENFRAAKLMRWMVGREGFTSEAHRRMEAEGVLSSDAVQLRIIREGLQDKGAAERLRAPESIAPVREFEVVLPSASKAELVAARAAEEIGTDMGFDDAAIGQIKAALVEACINAFEHSRLRYAKVFLRFVAAADRLTIHVHNSGADLDECMQAEGGGADGLPRKRGWGFELMKGLMDEVRVEKVRGGAKIVLVKYLVRKGDSRNGQEV